MEVEENHALAHSLRRPLGAAITLIALLTMLVAGGMYAGVLHRVGKPAGLALRNGNAIPTPKPSRFIAVPIPLGFVGVALPSHQTGGRPAEGDYVDISATVNTAIFSPVNPREVTRTVFDDVRVVRSSPDSIVVVLQQCDAEYLDWMLVHAALRYTLITPPDAAWSVDDRSYCASTAPPIGPGQVDARWGFTKANPVFLS